MYCSVSLGVVSLIPVPGLVHLSSSSNVYLYLFWSSWVPSGRCLSLLSHFLGRNSAFVHSFAFPFTCAIMRTFFFGLSRPFSLCRGGSSTEGSDLGQIGGGFGRPAIVVDRVPLVGPPSPHGKGKGKVSEIKYPGGSAYLRAVV